VAEEVEEVEEEEERRRAAWSAMGLGFFHQGRPEYFGGPVRNTNA
jgi:hypothetical protein